MLKEKYLEIIEKAINCYVNKRLKSNKEQKIKHAEIQTSLIANVSDNSENGELNAGEFRRDAERL